MIELSNNEKLLVAKDLYNKYYTNMYPRVLSSRLIEIEDKHDIDISEMLTDLDSLNDFIVNNYQNEQIIKSKFIRYLIKKGGNYVIDLELKSGESRIDICKFNGYSIGYEIKTEYDTYKRLNSQLEDYIKVFDKLYIIVPEKKYTYTLSLIPKYLGVYTYKIKNGEFSFTCRKKAIRIIDRNSYVQLLTLTKQEIIDAFNLTSVNSNKKDIINYICDKYSSRYINTMFITQMKKRNNKRWLFTSNNINDILDIDIQWVFKNNLLINKKGLVI